MFDFFIEIGNWDSKSKLERVFSGQEQYKNINHEKSCHYSNKFRAIVLCKNKKPENIYEDETVFVLIYGYTFTKLNTNYFKNKKQLNAKEIAQLYEKEGVKITDYIKGSYSIVIFNKKQESCLVFSDELNIRNVYYAHTDNTLLLSSSLSTFPAYNKQLFSKLNIKSVIEYYLFDFALNDETFIKNVKVAPEGSYLTFKSNTLKINKFWNIFKEMYPAGASLNSKEAIKQLNSLLKQNLGLYIDKSDSTAFALTGGYDSRLNLALLNGKFQNGFYFSYGRTESYDIKVAQKVADKLKLNYKPFILEETFYKDFNTDAETAIYMGDGIAEMNRANYIHVFKEISKRFNYVLTGLFGSELIKRPTSIGGYINENVKSILLSKDFKQTFEKIIEKEKSKAFINPALIEKYKNRIYKDVLNTPYLINDFDNARKFFFYIVGNGIRKYFMKEIKVERPFVTNLHPFLDIEFITLLLKTPFPWVYNWNTKKSYLANINIHKFYVWLINMNNKQLTNIVSTHAYKPKYLLHKIYLPLLAIQYFYYKKKFRKVGAFTNKKLLWDFYTQRKELPKSDNIFNNESLAEDYEKHIRDFSKLISLQVWIKNNNLD